MTAAKYKHMPAVTLKLSEKLRTRIARLAKQSGRTAHGLMVEALERQIAREERFSAFVREAEAADKEIEAGADVYCAEEVHAWMKALAGGKKPPRPKPLRR